MVDVSPQFQKVLDNITRSEMKLPREELISLLKGAYAVGYVDGGMKSDEDNQAFVQGLLADRLRETVSQ
jgi:hypothetical protein